MDSARSAPARAPVGASTIARGGRGAAAQVGEAWGGGANSVQGRAAARVARASGRSGGSSSARGLARQRGRERSTGASGGPSYELRTSQQSSEVTMALIQSQCTSQKTYHF